MDRRASKNALWVALLMGAVILYVVPVGQWLGAYFAAPRASRSHAPWQAELEAGQKAEHDGDTAAAERHYLRAYAEAHKGGPSHPDPGSQESAYLLGQFYLSQREFDRAPPFLEEAMQSASKLYGQDALEVADAQMRLVELYRATGDHERELDLARQVLRIREVNHQADRTLLVSSLNAVARALLELGRGKEALDLCQEAEVLQRERFAKQKRLLGFMLVDHARAAVQAGHTGEARKLYKEALVYLEETLQEDDEYLGRIRRTYEELGR